MCKILWKNTEWFSRNRLTCTKIGPKIPQTNGGLSAKNVFKVVTSLVILRTPVPNMVRKDI